MNADAVTRIVAVRHGETAWNVHTRIQGQLDVALNDHGREQARRVALVLAGEQLDAIYASDLERAHDTARAVAERTGLDLRTETALRERAFGIFEGLTWAEVEDRFPEDSRRWRQRDPGYGPQGGEVLAAFYERVVRGVGAIAARHRGEHIAIVTHGGVLDVLYRAASRVPIDAPRTWQLGNASINRLLHGEHGFSLVGWGDTLHLEDLALDEGNA